MCVAVTGLEKATIRHYAHKEDTEGDEITYEADFKIPPDFGIIGAIFVENEHHKEMYVKDIVLEGHPIGPLHFVCSSWVNEKDLPDSKRIFFTTKVISFSTLNFLLLHALLHQSSPYNTYICISERRMFC